MSLLPHLFLALAAIIGLAQILGRAFVLLRQPRVLGEMVAGILLGPSLLGRTAPSVESFLLPPAVLPELRGIAGFGVVLFMFLVGLELDSERLRAGARSALVVSAAGIAVPVVLSIPV